MLETKPKTTVEAQQLSSLDFPPSRLLHHVVHLHPSLQLITKRTTKGTIELTSLDLKSPEVPQSSVRPDLLQSLEILPHLLVDLVRNDVGVLSISDVLLPVKEPVEHETERERGENESGIRSVFELNRFESREGRRGRGGWVERTKRGS